MTDPVVEFILPVEWAGVDLTRSTAGASHGDAKRQGFPDLRRYALGGVLISLPAVAARNLPGWLLSLTSQLDCVRGLTTGAAISVPFDQALPHAGLTVISDEDGRQLLQTLRPVAVSEAGRAGVPRASFPIPRGVALFPPVGSSLVRELSDRGLGVRGWPQAAALPDELKPRIEVSAGQLTGYVFRLRLAARDRNGLIRVFLTGTFDMRGLQALSEATIPRREGRTTSGLAIDFAPAAVTPALLLEEATRPDPSGRPLTASEVEERLMQAARNQGADRDILARARLILSGGFTPRRQLDPAFRESILLHIPGSQRPGTTAGLSSVFTAPDGREYPIDPEGRDHAPGYGTPPPSAAQRGESCGSCRFWIGEGDRGYCTAWAFMADRSAWCETWDAQ